MRPLCTLATVLALSAIPANGQQPVPALPAARTAQPAAKPSAQPAAKPWAPPAPQPSAQAAPPTTTIVCPPHPLDGRTIVFVANGAGGGESCSENLRQASADSHAGLAVLKLSWSRQGTVKGDNGDHAGHERAAARLAARFEALRAECPHSRFVFVGYSAGSRIVLLAAELLPPGSLDRIVLLGASVSCYYDLHRALLTSCGGIDNFYSHDDGVLDMVQSMYGTTDGGKGPMAGLVGFRCPPGIAALGAYGNLRQYRWSSKYGGDGDHYYWVTDEFMLHALVPMLQTPGCPVVAVGPATPVRPAAPARPTAPGSQPAPSHGEPPLSRMGR
jgi:pimeloyl-ACP methyl ester carboxylesterase